MIKKTILTLLFATQIHAAPDEVSGEISLAKGVNVKTGGVLFIIAKNPGVPMPVAVVRVPDPKLPHKFKLTAKDVMTPGAPFVGPFTITARFSPSGDAMDKSGPEGTEAKPVSVGSSGVKIEMKAK